MDKWKERNRPSCLEKRFQFSSYEETRDFLDRLGKFSDSVKKYPDISFGKTYVNITIRPENEDSDSQVSGEDYDLANQIDDLE